VSENENNQSQRHYQERAERVLERAEQKEADTPVQLFLPGLDELMRAMPNHIARRGGPEEGSM
jgi:hypothetical protein